jgi:hypothetical protein
MLDRLKLRVNVWSRILGALSSRHQIAKPTLVEDFQSTNGDFRWIEHRRQPFL